MTVWNTKYPMCTRHANLTVKQMLNPDLLISVAVTIESLRVPDKVVLVDPSK